MDNKKLEAIEKILIDWLKSDNENTTHCTYLLQTHFNQLLSEQTAELQKEVDELSAYKTSAIGMLETHCEIIGELNKEINLLKSNQSRYYKEGKAVEMPISMYYTPEFGCQKHPQECYESDLKEWEKLPTASEWIEQAVKERERLFRIINSGCEHCGA